MKNLCRDDGKKIVPSFTPSLGDIGNCLDCCLDSDSGLTEKASPPEFTWPSNAGNASGIIWYAALTDPEVTQVFGEMDMWTFGWAEKGR